MASCIECMIQNAAVVQAHYIGQVGWLCEKHYKEREEKPKEKQDEDKGI